MSKQTLHTLIQLSQSHPVLAKFKYVTHIKTCTLITMLWSYPYGHRSISQPIFGWEIIETVNQIPTSFQHWYFNFKLGWFLVELWLRSWFLVDHCFKINDFSTKYQRWGWLSKVEAQRLNVDSTLRSWSSVPTGITLRKAPRQTWWKTVLAALTKNIKILVRNNGSVDKGRRKMSVSNMIHVYIRS